MFIKRPLEVAELIRRMLDLPRNFTFSKIDQCLLNTKYDFLFVRFAKSECYFAVIEFTTLIFTSQMNYDMIANEKDNFSLNSI